MANNMTSTIPSLANLLITFTYTLLLLLLFKYNRKDY